MNHVLYEASYKFDPVLLIPIFMMIYIAVFPSILKQRINHKQKLEDKDYHYNEKFVKRFCMGGLVWCIIFSIIALFSQIDMYNKIVKAYKQGNYQIVEGYVYYNSTKGNVIVYIEKID